MLHRILLLIPALVCLYSASLANDYEEAWKALHKNDRKTAKALLEKAMQESSTSVDAYLTYVYLQTFEGRETEVKDFMSRIYKRYRTPTPTSMLSGSMRR
ncbi:hypothetical protein [Paraflavitalea speifideaquila]|uniref:hypothetical protein n=1 Tax=Paraflavitalea speifideaquila TaxID=3076558 RepID=UPI0028EF3E68|nr:hypothetical protein [Paraflavitalea speifideiaquila]